jgi:hypothetical protein
LALVALLAGCAQLAPLEGEPFAFGVLGDTPYSEAEARALDALIGRMNQDRLSFVVHVGDLGTSARAQACSDDWIRARQLQLRQSFAPVIVLPGDNEWTDCARHGLDPQQRLAAWRKLFCNEAPGLLLERQREHCENVRWHAADMTFIGLNVPGGSDPALGDARMAATLEWLDTSLSVAEARRSRRIVVFMHADPRFERVGADDAYGRLRAVLATHAKWFQGRLVLVHGDTHHFRDDEPVPGLRRIEPWGAPFVSWLRVAPIGVLRVEAGF